MALLERLLEVSPGEIAEDVERMRDHVELDVDPSNPPSQDFENFPPDVQETALRVQDHIAAAC